MTNRFANLFQGFFDSEKVAGLLLIICTGISLVVANSRIGESYVEVIHHSLLTFPGSMSFEHVVNDGLMAIFFLLVGLEVEREIYVGELADFKKALLPVVGAVGGICLPAFIHFIFNNGTEAQAGFAIPMATDIAFALGVLALAGNRVPVSAKIFLTALAIIDDIGAIIVIALFYTKTIDLSFLIGALGIFAGLLILNKLRVQRLLFYLLPGVLMWYLFLKSGVHATVSGVLLAFAIPFNKIDSENVSLKLQHYLHKPVAFLIVPLFALVNTAIPIQSSIIQNLISPNSLGIMFGLVAGKLVGIVSVPYLFVKIGLAAFQDGFTQKNLIGIGFLGGIGFTMSMFISNLAFNDPEMINSSKIAILTGSIIAAILGLGLFLTNRKIPEG